MTVGPFGVGTSPVTMTLTHLVRSTGRQAALTSGLLLFGWAAANGQAISVSGSPAAMKVTAAVAGSAPTAITNAVTTYTVKTNKANNPQKITAKLNAVMP